MGCELMHTINRYVLTLLVIFSGFRWNFYMPFLATSQWKILILSNYPGQICILFFYPEKALWVKGSTHPGNYINCQVYFSLKHKWDKVGLFSNISYTRPTLESHNFSQWRDRWTKRRHSQIQLEWVIIIETINECFLKQLTICNGTCVFQSLFQCDLFPDTMTSRDVAVISYPRRHFWDPGRPRLWSPNFSFQHLELECIFRNFENS